MDVQEVAPGLWRWTAWHEEWRHQVGCVYLERGGSVCLIDPLVPPEEPERFFAALDRDVARAGGPVHVLVTVFWHTRSARELAARYGARVWASARARAAVARRAGEVTDPFRPGDALPAGIEARATPRGGEVVLYLPDAKAVVPGDVILGAAGGGLRLCPEGWLPAGKGHAELRETLRPLAALDVERVLVSHGEPVLERGGEALRALLLA
jgi:glyoxylase-like metal-dependent hydrolase (beta-lactamase superfamily II)